MKIKFKNKNYLEKGLVTLNILNVNIITNFFHLCNLISLRLLTFNSFSPHLLPHFLALLPSLILPQAIPHAKTSWELGMVAHACTQEV